MTCGVPWTALWTTCWAWRSHHGLAAAQALARRRGARRVPGSQGVRPAGLGAGLCPWKGPALALCGRPLCRHGLRDHAPADPGEAGAEILAAVHGAVPHGGCPGGCEYRGRAGGVAGAGIQPPCPCVEASLRPVLRPAWRSPARHLPGAAGTAGRGSGHRRRGHGLCPSAARGLRGDQRAHRVPARALP